MRNYSFTEDFSQPARARHQARKCNGPALSMLVSDKCMDQGKEGRKAYIPPR